MERYFINDVERLTGISAHSLRAWETRYGVLIPHRTTTNIRYYDADQVRRLLNISVLKDAGYRISKLMKLTDDEMSTAILMLEEQHDAAADQLEIPVNKLVASMLAYDEESFSRTLAAAIRRLGLYDAMLQVVYPFLRKTSLLWSTDNITPAQEHFASQVIKRKLLTAIDEIPFPENTAKRFLLFLPQGDLHEIGLLFSDYLIRRAGYRSINLGPNLPHSSLVPAVESIRPTHLLTFFGSGTDTEQHLANLTELLRAHKKLHLLICTALTPESKQLPDRVRFLDQPPRLFDHL